MGQQVQHGCIMIGVLYRATCLESTRRHSPDRETFDLNLPRRHHARQVLRLLGGCAVTAHILHQNESSRVHRNGTRGRLRTLKKAGRVGIYWDVVNLNSTHTRGDIECGFSAPLLSCRAHFCIDR